MIAHIPADRCPFEPILTALESHDSGLFKRFLIRSSGLRFVEIRRLLGGASKHVSRCEAVENIRKLAEFVSFYLSNVEQASNQFCELI